MARKAKKDTETAPATAEETIPATILDHMARNNPPPAAAPSPQVDVDGLLKKIATLEASQERLERTNMALMSQPPAPSWSTPAPQVHISAPAPLPDALTDAEGYGAALEARIMNKLQAQEAQRRAEAERASAESQRVDYLWQSFEKKYPELAEHSDLVEVAATKVLREAQAMGMDVNKYMTAAQDRFFNDVASRMKSDYGKLFEVDEETSTPSAAHASAVQRTAGVFGGVDAGTKGAKPAEAQPGDLSEDLIALQRKSGYY